MMKGFLKRVAAQREAEQRADELQRERSHAARIREGLRARDARTTPEERRSREDARRARYEARLRRRGFGFLLGDKP